MKIRKLTAVILSFVLAFSFIQITASAGMSKAEWDSYFERYSETYGNPLMEPGSDDTQRNFSWYSPAGSRDCKVIVSENEDMTGAKEFGGKTERTPEGDCVNKVTVTELEPEKTYYYKCVTSLSQSAEASFSTVSGADFTAMYVTDIHVTYNEDGLEDPLRDEAYTVHRVLESALSKRDLDLVISAGDQASYGLRTEYISLFSSPLWGSVPFALCAGNHDRKGFDFRYFNNNPNKYTKGISSYIANDYWYVKGDVLFLVFDSNCFAALSHRNFVKDAVTKNPGVKWKVAAFHHDMYGIMSEKRMDYSEDYLRPIFGEICDEFGIDLVLTGHTHHYSMSNVVFGCESAESIEGKDSITDPAGTVYMVSASINHPRGEDNTVGDVFDENMGYYYLSDEPLYNLLDFSENSITVSTYTINGDEPIRTFTINKTSAQGGHPEYTPDSGRFFYALKLELKAFFEEIGIAIKVIFNKSSILDKMK